MHEKADMLQTSERREDLLRWLWGVSEASLFVLLFPGLYSGMFQRTQSTILVVYCQGSERAH